MEKSRRTEMKKILLTGMICWLLLFLVSGCGSNNSNLKVREDAVYDDNDYKKITEANNALGFDLLQEIALEEDGNIFISPTSLLMAMGMLYNSAEGETKKEIASVLHLNNMEAEEINQANASLMVKLHEHMEKDEIQLNIANSLWLNDKFQFQDDFKKQNETYYNAETKNIDTEDPKAADKINKWASNATNEKITQIVETPLNPQLVAILINAIYFQGNWTLPFDKEKTTDDTFYLADGTEKTVPMMQLDEEISYMENKLFQAVKLPYGEKENMYMHIYLPKEGVETTEWDEKWIMKKWKQWQEDFDIQQGTLKLPRFQVEYEVKLNEVLKRLGLVSAFTGEANLSKMIKDNHSLMIDWVKQKTYLDVDEKGTEAAAVTSIGIVETSIKTDKPFVMEVNRPFYLIIMDEKLDVQLFLGKINDPLG